MMAKPPCGRGLKLKNVASKYEVQDTLHNKASTTGVCSPHACNGSIMMPMNEATEPRSKFEIQRLAKEFIDEYYQSIKRFNSEQHCIRWDQVSREIEEKGTYELTQTELVYGAKLAWRNAPRCIGRIQWSKLQVFDARYVTTATGMFETICKHIKYGTNKGNLRSAITIFSQRTDGKHDFRLWNPQLLGYAGYTDPDGTVIGDPANVEFTEICQKLGWKGKGGRWDILPLILSANGQDPEWFEIPKDLVLEVDIVHPMHDWFEELHLRWYSLPAVSNMLFDCGGLQFPAAPFNGWYMATEIGARDLCDAQRFNILPEVGKKMGLDTSTNINLWKDRAVVEVNLAVLYSFQKQNVTIMDHHTASESFMKHLENEQRLRGGCPADWIWIVPPISGSITPVFHQEMSLYYLKPSYEYQLPAWKTHVWIRSQENGEMTRPRRKFTFKEIARAVKFTSKLFSKALSKRIKATILYATETGKSENYAKKLGEIFGHTFNVHVHSMEEYDIINIEHEALVIVVTSTFGNGDPPENGETFAKKLYTMKMSGTAADIEMESYKQIRSFMKLNSVSEAPTPVSPQEKNGNPLSFNIIPNVGMMSENIFGPLSNIRFAVFALGSSAYPNFCAFGIYVDNLLADLGAERLLPVTCGDELAGQEQKFKQWAGEVFQVGCDTFCLDDEHAIREATASLKKESSASSRKVKIVKATQEIPITEGLSKTHGKKVKCCEVVTSRNLHHESTSRWTQQVVFQKDFSKDFNYHPGDHVAIYPANQSELVDFLINHFTSWVDPNQPVQILVMKEVPTLSGIVTTWEPHDRLPEASIRTFLTRYLDITTPPTPNFLLFLAEYAEDENHKNRLRQLATDTHDYEEWKHLKYPHIPEVLQEFPSVQVEAVHFITQLPLLQSRFYSISSSPLVHKSEIHITVAVVEYQTEGGSGPVHYGVCSNYLNNVKAGDKIQCFVRSSSSFHLPSDASRPVILVGPGTGVAPFRGFWHHRFYLSTFLNERIGSMTLFFGCRTRDLDLYRDEKEDMVKSGILKNSYIALSRDNSIPKTYVQDMLVKVGPSVFREIVLERGHFYVCGDCTMAECVYQRLKSIIQEQGKMNDIEVEKYMMQMRDEDRYHEDIFGITLRTEEIHRQSRESARNKNKLMLK